MGRNTGLVSLGNLLPLLTLMLCGINTALPTSDTSAAIVKGDSAQAIESEHATALNRRRKPEDNSPAVIQEDAQLDALDSLPSMTKRQTGSGQTQAGPSQGKAGSAQAQTSVDLTTAAPATKERLTELVSRNVKLVTPLMFSGKVERIAKLIHDLGWNEFADPNMNSWKWQADQFSIVKGEIPVPRLHAVSDIMGATISTMKTQKANNRAKPSLSAATELNKATRALKYIVFQSVRDSGDHMAVLKAILASFSPTGELEEWPGLEFNIGDWAFDSLMATAKFDDLAWFFAQRRKTFQYIPTAVHKLNVFRGADDGPGVPSFVWEIAPVDQEMAEKSSDRRALGFTDRKSYPEIGKPTRGQWQKAQSGLNLGSMRGSLVAATGAKRPAGQSPASSGGDRQGVAPDNREAMNAAQEEPARSLFALAASTGQSQSSGGAGGASASSGQAPPQGPGERYFGYSPGSDSDRSELQRVDPQIGQTPASPMSSPPPCLVHLRCHLEIVSSETTQVMNRLAAMKICTRGDKDGGLLAQMKAMARICACSGSKIC